MQLPINKLCSKSNVSMAQVKKFVTSIVTEYLDHKLPTDYTFINALSLSIYLSLDLSRSISLSSLKRESRHD